MLTYQTRKLTTKNFFFYIIVLATFFICERAIALEPSQVLVVYNSKSMESIRLAEYYRDVRNIPHKNMCPVKCSTNELIPRNIYEEQIRVPIETYLITKNLKDTILCIVLIYGMPMKIFPQEVLPLEKESGKLKRLIKDKEAFLNAGEEVARLQQELDEVTAKLKTLYGASTRSSVDSELTLILQGDYKLENQVLNPYYFFPDKKYKPFSREFSMYMVARLDAPEAGLVIAMIDNAILAEKNGLKGNAYFDERGVKSDNPYSQMDEYIRITAKMTEEAGFKTVVDEQSTLFDQGACPNTAIYWGWYSLEKYIDSFTFEPGAIGVHVASTECNTLKGDKNLWCLQMIKRGVTATIGPVCEPYLHSFPNPVVFWGALFNGYSLVEAYFISSPFLSWRMVLVGDPLYTPFKYHKLGIEQAETSNDSTQGNIQ